MERTARISRIERMKLLLKCSLFCRSTGLTAIGVVALAAAAVVSVHQAYPDIYLIFFKSKKCLTERNERENEESLELVVVVVVVVVVVDFFLFFVFVFFLLLL